MASAAISTGIAFDFTICKLWNGGNFSAKS